MNFFKIVLMITIFSSCSSIKDFIYQDSLRYDRAQSLVLVEPSDYIDQLDYFGQQYITNEKAIKLTGNLATYLEEIYHQLSSKNEIVFDDEKKPTFYVLKDSSSYHFSLPGRAFVFSSGLFKRFISNEEILIGILSYESIRSLKAVYKKNQIIPSDQMQVDSFLKLFSLDSEEKMMVDQWVYVVLKRSGFDPGAYLKYLQMRNKINDASLVASRSAHDMVREELMYKSFMVKQKVKGRGVSVNKENSSKSFYVLSKFVERL
jgi:hypothetical protein